MTSRIFKSLERVRKSFPELNNSEIKIHYSGELDCSMVCTPYTDGSYFIEVNSKRLFEAPDDVLDGCLAHELGHVLMLNGMSSLEFFFRNSLLTKIKL